MSDTGALTEISAELDGAAQDLAADRPRQAFERAKRVLRDRPDHPRALAMLGQIAVYQDQPGAGLQALQRAVALDPRLEHRVWLALCLAKLGCGDDAVQIIAVGVPTMPPTANAHFAVGMVYCALGRHQDAARFYARCAALDASRTDAIYRHARALHAAGETSLAIDAYARAIEQRGTQAECHADLSAALSDLGRFDDARAAAETAVDLDPGCIVAHNNLGHALLNLNRGAEAVIAYGNAIEACDTYAKAQFGQALARLKCGDFERGWRQYEWRWRTTQTPRADLSVPRWDGGDLGGRTILLHAEQGLGDTLQFVRFAPLVAEHGGRVVLQVQAPLVRLLRRVAGVADVLSFGDPVPAVDMECPMASLPMAFDLRLETVPAAVYLPRTCAVRPAGLTVGLVWAGDPRPSEPRLNMVDRRRSTALEVLAPLLDVAGVRFVSFQFGDARRQVAAFAGRIADGMEGVVDFADTAARLAQVDLLISVDTSMAHLAGGLGVPVWMLSRFDGCWRWLEDRADSPWYPSMRIFRQASPGDWAGVVANVRAALAAEASRRC